MTRSPRVWPGSPAAPRPCLRALKARLGAPADGIDVRHLLFAHTVLSAFEVPGLRGPYRVGRLLSPDEAAGVPAVYDVITTPRAVAPGGTMGALEIDSAGTFAVYGRALETALGSWPPRERLGNGDPAFGPPGN